MTRATRPTQIAQILKTIAAEYPDDMGASLEAYIADLEAKQSDRPAQIAAILKTIDSDHPLDMGIFLEGYISALEAGQQAISIDKEAASEDSESLYWRVEKRKQKLRQKAIRKSYQGQ